MNSRNSFPPMGRLAPFDSPGASSSFGAASSKSWWARTKRTCRVWSRFQNAMASVMGRLLPKTSRASRADARSLGTWRLQCQKCRSWL